MNETKTRTNALYILILAGFFVLCVLLLFTIFRLGKTQKTFESEGLDKHLAYAGNLSNSGLYKRAAEEYEKILENYSIELKRKINLIFILGNLYMDNLRDYERALANYIKLKTYYPDNPYMNEVNQRVVVCLEKLGRYSEASYFLQQASSIVPSSSHPGKVVAVIGGRSITLRELDEMIRDLPESLKVKYSSPQGKLEFLRNNLLARELLYNLAIKEGLNKDENYIRRIARIEKDILVQMAYENELSNFKKNPTDEELRLLYDAKKDSLYKGKRFEDVRGELITEYSRLKAKEAESKIIEKLVAGEKIEIYPESLGLSAPAIKFGGGE